MKRSPLWRAVVFLAAAACGCQCSENVPENCSTVYWWRDGKTGWPKGYVIRGADTTRILYRAVHRDLRGGREDMLGTVTGVIVFVDERKGVAIERYAVISDAYICSEEALIMMRKRIHYATHTLEALSQARRAGASAPLSPEEMEDTRYWGRLPPR